MTTDKALKTKGSNEETSNVTSKNSATTISSGNTTVVSTENIEKANINSNSNAAAGYTSGTASTKSGASTKKGNAVTTKKSVNGENTGRWTKEEHAAFIEGLNKHGKEWKKIANMIETRTVVQIRTHAQKYFQKIAKTKYEMKGKQPPTDLVSTASNPNRNSSGDKKRSYRSSKKNAKLIYALSTNDPKENSPQNGTKQKKGNGTLNKRSAPLKNAVYTRKKKKVADTSPLSKTSKSKKDSASEQQAPGLKLNLSEIMKGEKKERHQEEQEEEQKNQDKDRKKPKGLTISTNIAQLRKKYDEEDLQWMKSSLNVYTKMADASPTSVAEFGIYRTFGGADEDYSSLESNSDKDELFTFDSESISDWISHKSDDSISTTERSKDAPFSPEPAPCDPDAAGENGSVSGFGLNVDETIANWINSPLTDEDECTLESFSGMNIPRFIGRIQ